MHQQIGKAILIVGIVTVLIGLVVFLWGNKFNWMGNLPGDIRIEKENFKFYFPVITMIIISALLTLVINLIKRFFQ